jgi:hypothetical protein
MFATRRQWAVVLLTVLVGLAGCSGAGGGDLGLGSSAGGDGGAAPGAETGGGSAGGDAGADAGGVSLSLDQQGQVDTDDRALIRRGRVRVSVESYDRSASNLTRLAEDWGGYVGDREISNDQVGNETVTRGRIVFRVPADRFEEFLVAVRNEGEVRRIETNATDVTDRLVDLEARLANLRAERERLRTLFDQAEETEDVIAVERRLSEVQGEIERIEARKRALEDRVALATVTVFLEEPYPDRDLDRTRWYDVGLIAAFLESVAGVATTLRALAVGLAYAAPYLVVFGVPVVGVVVGLLRWRRRRTRDQAGGVETASADDPAESPPPARDTDIDVDEAAPSPESGTNADADSEGADATDESAGGERSDEDT